MRGIVFFLFLVSPAWARLPTEMRFDFGPAEGPVSKAFISVSNEDAYTVDRGHGFYKCKPPKPFDDGTPGAAEAGPLYDDIAHPFDVNALRDGVEADGPVQFRANLYPGQYVVSIAVGRYSAARHDMRVRVNDEVVAENLDAWGPYVTVAGGPATRTVKTVAHTDRGKIVVAVDFARPDTDRWKEYTDREPAGGELEFLGENAASLLAITFRPVRPVPVVMKDGELKTALTSEPIPAVINAMNAGQTDEALDQLAAIEERGLSMPKGLLLEECNRRLGLGAHQEEIERLAQSVMAFKFALRFAPNSPTLLERLEQNRRYHWTLGLVRDALKEDTSEEDQAQGLWKAYGLAFAFDKEDPYFSRASVLCGQIANWAAQKGGWKHCKALAAEHFKAARAADPNLKFSESLSP